ncbi:hypothetical protein OG884_17520 [Streptosporangium sp. NBC_01755]|uniref:hypothetical protein n=1 Tax=Streptosporangium sp. NBC_01755 TaxID=2975949 RepID=UPI002DDB03D7|nr:hypothetical protein [Streptosporangium sp. NBC_01755]WSD03609.1 hypothetical protein OG884_17520 [Streptosporangium sp. NBC_01755]
MSQHIECHHNRIYEITGLDVVPLPGEVDAAQVTAKINAGYLKGKLVKVTGPGVRPALTEAETRALTWQLAALATGRDLRLKQYRLLVPLDPEGSLGQVILSFDQNYNAEATLVGRGLPVNGPALAGNLGVLKKQLVDTYHLSAITGEWTVPDLTKIHHALALVPAADRVALYGLELARVTQLAAKADDTVGGHIQARLTEILSPYSGSWGRLTVTDVTFIDDEKGFYGGTAGAPARPPSLQVILHEVGHALDSLNRRTLSRRTAEKALTGIGEGAGVGTPAPLPQDRIDHAVERKIMSTAPWRELAVLAFDTVDATQKRTAQADALAASCTAKGGALADLAQLLKSGQQNNAIQLYKQIEQEFNTLNTAYDAIVALLRAQGQGAKVPPTEFTNIIGKLPPQPANVIWADLHNEIIRFCGIQADVALWRRKFMDGKEFFTDRGSKFVGAVNEGQISLGLTTYSHATQDPTELYTEAYAIWILDPEEIRKHSAALFTYFDTAQYRLP